MAAMAISEMMNFLIAALPSAPVIICKGKGGNSVSFAQFYGIGKLKFG
jgi:hypothetical protein